MGYFLLFLLFCVYSCVQSNFGPDLKEIGSLIEQGKKRWSTIWVSRSVPQPGHDFPGAPHALQQLRRQDHHHRLGGAAYHVEEKVQVFQLIAILGAVAIFPCENPRDVGPLKKGEAEDRWLFVRVSPK